MGCGRDSGGGVACVYPRARGILAANLGCLCEIGAGVRCGNRGGMCMCVYSAMGTRVYVIVMDLLDVTVHVYDCDCVTKS